MFIIIHGDPIVGFRYYGPFPNEEKAMEFANIQLSEVGDWWPTKLDDPNEFEDTTICGACGVSGGHMPQCPAAALSSIVHSDLPKSLDLELSKIGSAE